MTRKDHTVSSRALATPPNEPAVSLSTIPIVCLCRARPESPARVFATYRDRDGPHRAIDRFVSAVSLLEKRLKIEVTRGISAEAADELFKSLESLKVPHRHNGGSKE